MPMTLGLSAAQAQRHFRDPQSLLEISTLTFLPMIPTFSSKSPELNIYNKVLLQIEFATATAPFAAWHKKVGSQRKQGKRWFLSVMGHI